MKFTYSVARFVPDTTRGEFINIAVVVVSPSDQLAWRFVSDYSRALAIGPKDLLDFCISHLTLQLEERNRPESQRVRDQGESAEAWLRQMHIDMNNLLQWKRPLPISCDTIEEALETAAKVFLFP